MEREGERSHQGRSAAAPPTRWPRVHGLGGGSETEPGPLACALKGVLGWGHRRHGKHPSVVAVVPSLPSCSSARATLRHAFKSHISTHGRLEPCEADGEQAMGGRSLRLQTWLGKAVALAWLVPGGPPRRQYQWCCRFLRARAPEQPCGTPSRAAVLTCRCWLKAHLLHGWIPHFQLHPTMHEGHGEDGRRGHDRYRYRCRYRPVPVPAPVPVPVPQRVSRTKRKTSLRLWPPCTYQLPTLGLGPCPVRRYQLDSGVL